MKIPEIPKSDRPRERLERVGVENLKDSELLAILLRTGREGKNVLEIAEDILAKYSKKKILDTSHEDLKKLKGIDTGKACTLLAAFEFTRRVMGAHKNGRPVIETEEQALAQLHDIRNLKKEHFVALYLNARNELVHRENISIGTVNASIVHPRDVFAPALEHNATAVIVAHNHPSGNPEPSNDDIEITQKLKKAGKLLDIRLIDHIIVANALWTSIISDI